MLTFLPVSNRLNGLGKSIRNYEVSIIEYLPAISLENRAKEQPGKAF